MRIPAAIIGFVAAITSGCAQAQSNGDTTGTSQIASVEAIVFEVPAGSHPHDVAPGPEGQIWYTGQRRGTLGIIDIATGEVREVPLGEGSAPHGVIQGPDGKAYITDSGQNAILRYDRSEEHTSELQSLMRISYAVFCLKKKKNNTYQ